MKNKKILKICTYVVIVCIALIVAIAFIGGGSDDESSPDELKTRISQYAAGNVSEREIIDRFKSEYGQEKVKKAYEEYAKEVKLNFTSRAYGRAVELLKAGADKNELKKLLLQAGFSDEDSQKAIEKALQ